MLLIHRLEWAEVKHIEVLDLAKVKKPKYQGVIGVRVVSEYLER